MAVTVCKSISTVGCMTLSDTPNILLRAGGGSDHTAFVPFFYHGGDMSDYRALYRKWRPRTFDDVCGQDGITDILKYEVANSKLSHAYLFCGSRGTGKTSCAKILAKAVNCLNLQNGNPCNECEACRSIDSGIATDVIEMDAASNNGISDVRDIQDDIAFTPAELKYRVYIIDEVHMMSSSAFNALLKTLEEPPSYVIFILATTEYNKLPTTIVSRCQRFDFKRISVDIIVNHLKRVADAEGIEITDDAARVIARVSRGGMRDAISLFELCAGARKKIDEELVFETVGSGNRDDAYGIIEAVGKADFSTVYEIVNEMVMRSGDVSVFWQEIIDSYRDIMIVKNSDKAKKYLDLTESEYETLSRIASKFTMSRLSYHVSILESAMADMQRAFNSKRSIAEIALTRMCDPRLDNTPEALALRIEELEKELARLKYSSTPARNTEQITEAKVQALPSSANEDKVDNTSAASEAQPSRADAVYSDWGAVIEKIGAIKPALSAAIAAASVYRNSKNEFTLRLAEIFAKKISSSEQDLAILKGVIGECEGIDPSTVKLNVLSKNQSMSSAFSDIENALK